jgi:hypothetical protein
VVAQLGHVGFGRTVVGEVGGAHVGREAADDVYKGFFRFVHFVAARGGGEGGEVGVGPGVGGDLVAFVVGSSDDVGPLRYFVDVAVAVAADNEERGFDVVAG